MKFLGPACLLILVFLLNSCSVTRYVPQGKQLYYGASLDLQHPDSIRVADLRNSLENVIAPDPTPRLLGSPVQVWWYYQTQTPKKKGIFAKLWRAIKKGIGGVIGSEPVYYDPLATEQVIDLLANRAENLGFFRAQSDASVMVDSSARAVTVDYEVVVNRPYVLDTLREFIRDSSVARVIDSVEQRSLVQPGDRYNLFVLENERTRLQDALRDEGYYYFTDNDLEYFADTLGNDHDIYLLLKLKDDLAHQKLIPQYIKNIRVYSNYQLGDSIQHIPGDTIRYDSLTIICDDCPLRHSILAEGIAYRPGLRYNPQRHNTTLRRLSNFNTFKYISISYDTLTGSDSLLNLSVFLTPRAKRTIEGEVGIVFNNGNYFGPEIAMTYLNRNLFGGAELLRLDGNLTYNYYLGGNNDAAFPSFGRYGFRSTLNIPRLWIPNSEGLFPNLTTGNTRFSLGFESEQLPFRLNTPSFVRVIDSLQLEPFRDELARDSSYTSRATFSTWTFQYGYTWQNRPKVVHETNPLTFRIQSVSPQEEALIPLLREARGPQVGDQAGLLRLERMRLWSPDYIYLIDSRIDGLETHNFYYRQRLAMNFNQVSPIRTAEGRDPAPENSQFLQVETDFRYYLIFNNKTSIASRFRAFVGYPFSKRAIIPYFDLYTVGGGNSMRAFAPRGLGPGTLARDPDQFSPFAGYGNILLETNLELRQRMGPMFELALFTDIGNVWEYRTLDPPPPNDFRLDTFYEQLAVAGGVGFRLDLDFLLIRLDLAYPLVLPYERPQEGLLQNTNFVLAFGYPF